MALLQLNSTNPKLSFIIKKNPASGMNIVEHKSGHLFGWYSPSQCTYNVWFKDKLKANSYGEQDFNNTLQYSSPMFVLDAINTFLSDNFKKSNEFDIQGFSNSISINLVAYAQSKILNSFISHFPEYQFEVVEIGHCKKINISTEKTIHELVNLTALLFCMFELRKTDLYVDATLLIKYIHSLNRVDAPYFIRYLFKMYLLRNRNDFKEVKDVLEDNGKYKLTFGDNYLARVQATESVISLDLPIVDIGCGEGKFLKFLAPKVSKYLAIDKDLEVLKSAEAKIKRDEISNVSLFNNSEVFDSEVNLLPKFTGLLIEVIEHMPLESAKELMAKTLQYQGLNQLVVTTPNRDFNQYYLIKTGFRHDDHHYELNEAEFKELIISLTPSNFQVKFINIGDEINGIATTMGAIWERK